MSARDILDPARANALAALLRDQRRFTPGAALPPFFDQVYFWDASSPEALAEDGHRRLGEGLIPDLGLPRRMWAGGRLAFHADLIAGEPAEKRSEVEKIDEKVGRSGRLGFVTVRHEIRQAGVLRRTEWQDVVYLEDAGENAPKPMVKRAPEDEEPEVWHFGEADLFRYSALTYNAHRIHYDTDYARREGYPERLVHGPLLAQILVLRAECELGPLAGFRFRATAPVPIGEEIVTCRYGPTLWVRGADGRLCMEASAEPARRLE